VVARGLSPFDFDSVLTDREPLHLRSYRELMAADGGELDEDTFRGLIGRKERERVETSGTRRGFSGSPASLQPTGGMSASAPCA
jgi:beta-phosphoglucomutase-like phosphatase (HAD superfamily)